MHTGCVWWHRPRDFNGGWSAARKLHALVLRWHLGEGVHDAGDFSSVNASPVTGPRWFRWRQKMDGVKRHVLVGFGDILVAVVVTQANVQDRAAFPELLRRAKRTAPMIACVWVDMWRLDRANCSTRFRRVITGRFAETVVLEALLACLTIRVRV